MFYDGSWSTAKTQELTGCAMLRIIFWCWSFFRKVKKHTAKVPSKPAGDGANFGVHGWETQESIKIPQTVTQKRWFFYDSSLTRKFCHMGTQGNGSFQWVNAIHILGWQWNIPTEATDLRSLVFLNSLEHCCLLFLEWYLIYPFIPLVGLFQLPAVPGRIEMDLMPKHPTTKPGERKSMTRLKCLTRSFHMISNLWVLDPRMTHFTASFCSAKSGL